MKTFFEWILNIDDVKLDKANDGEVDIKFPKNLLIKYYFEPIEAIIQSTYPFLLQDVNIKEMLHDYAIPMPKPSMVDEVNSYMLSMNDKDKIKHFSSDSICKTSLNSSYQVDLLTLKVLNWLKCFGLPNHSLKLKVGVPIMFIKNIGQIQVFVME